MKKLLFVLILSFRFIAKAQDSTSLPHQFEVNGYLKNMQTLSFDKDLDLVTNANLLHNRINLRWKPSSKFTHVVEIRNRLFWGEQIKLTPNFASLLKNENEKINLQKVWFNQPSMVLLSNVERLYSDYKTERLNIRLGRQRINWGVNTTWNPNDIFNSYNFLDFDYEERSGVDAAKLSYILKNSLQTELAYAKTGQIDGDILALKSSVNKWNYDFQLITGWYRNHATVGAGWAGAIKDAGFKGEIQYYFKNRDSTSHLNLSLESDYLFKKGWYLNVGLLLNSKGTHQPLGNFNDLNLNISPENLMPTQWNIIVTTAKEINPLFSVNMSVLYTPGTNLMILYPTLQYNLATNLDASLITQSFFAELNHHFEAVNHQCFLRLKWSY
ncbi:hypothetical protein N9R54_04325 [Pelobium sp.]|nr:hypothetical protein [Pelobium sp.]MDA9555440.1 hypothetical protein [Pelobium sp.]